MQRDWRGNFIWTLPRAQLLSSGWNRGWRAVPAGKCGWRCREKMIHVTVIGSSPASRRIIPRRDFEQPHPTTSTTNLARPLPTAPSTTNWPTWRPLRAASGRCAARSSSRTACGSNSSPSDRERPRNSTFDEWRLSRVCLRYQKPLPSKRSPYLTQKYTMLVKSLPARRTSPESQNSTICTFACSPC